ncbi:hypothetical protein O9K51_04706 [Purpureocillium lavendulum]|uniref:Uncharacterized protein n=1 Tax=Purpureocillium lavendulum TaxID=1247861 RepID=A0AB34FWK7_9HYPO|nr:hypothetical protein O9K51_04706 [Purpureocillium lavendulum]
MADGRLPVDADTDTDTDGQEGEGEDEGGREAYSYVFEDADAHGPDEARRRCRDVGGARRARAPETPLLLLVRKVDDRMQARTRTPIQARMQRQRQSHRQRHGQAQLQAKERAARRMCVEQLYRFDEQAASRW